MHRSEKEAVLPAPLARPVCGEASEISPATVTDRVDGDGLHRLVELQHPLQHGGRQHVVRLHQHHLHRSGSDVIMILRTLDNHIYLSAVPSRKVVIQPSLGPTARN